MTPEKPYTAADLDPHERANYEVLSKEEQNRYLAIQNHFKAITESEELTAVSEEEAEIFAKEIERSESVPNLVEERNINKIRAGLWQTDEDDEFGQNEDADDDDSEDLITSVAESEMEVHREIREYTRIAAWDLPLLLRESTTARPAASVQQSLLTYLLHRIDQRLGTPEHEIHSPSLPVHNLPRRRPPSR